MRPILGCSLIALSLAAMLACKRNEASSRATPQQTASAARAPASAFASAPVAPSASAPVASVPVESLAHCKALGKKGSLTFNPVLEEEVALKSEGDTVFALGFTHALARSRLYRFSRAGGPLERVAEQRGLGDRKGFAVAGGAGFYVQAGKLFKLGPGKDTSVELYGGAHSPPVVVGDRVLVISCDAKNKVDHLLQIPRDGGAAETVAELPRVSQEDCKYSSLVADERQVFIADWNGSRVLAVSRADHAVSVLVAKRGFPGDLLLERDGLVYLSAIGLFRVAREGGDATLLAADTLALAPYSFVEASSAAYWVFDAFAYTQTTTLYRIPRAGGPPKTILVLRNQDPDAQVYEGQGLQDFTLDDECLYIAQRQYKRAGTQILVRALE